MNALGKTTLSLLLCALAFPLSSWARIEEGDTLSFWSVAYVDWQPDVPVSQREIAAVCNTVGEDCYVFIDTTLAQVPAQPRIDAMAEAFDTGYSLSLPSLYGPLPDEFDGDPRIFILIIPQEGWTGYFDPAQQMADSLVLRLWEKHSSEREIVYLASTAFTYSSELTVLAHEFGHMLHWGQDHSPEPPEDPVKYWEDAWIDEAFATFAPVYLIEDVNAPDVYDYAAFFATQPDLSLIHFASYDQVQLWATFMWEHYGGEDFMSTLIADQENGLPGVRNTLASLGHPETFEDAFEHWIIANYLDDEEYEGGRYSYYHYNFPSCRLASVHGTYPTGVRTSTVFSFAADYIAFDAPAAAPITVDFSGDSTSMFRVSCILVDRASSEVMGIQSVPLDSLNRGSLYSEGFGTTYDRLVMAVMNVDEAMGEEESAQYTYEASVETSGIDRDEDRMGSTKAPFTSLDQNYPNPFNPVTTMTYRLAEESRVKLIVFDCRGHAIQNLVDEVQAAGTHRIEWDGRDSEGNAVPSGIYFCRLVADGFVETRKMLLAE
jgi:hypothetical protein